MEVLGGTQAAGVTPPLSSLLGLMSPHDHLLLEKTLLTWRPPGS